MMFNDIAEYEDSDSQLAKDTILRLSNEISDLKEDNENMKYTAKQLLMANKDICDRNRKAIKYIEIFKNDIRGLDELVLIKILKGDDIDE